MITITLQHDECHRYSRHTLPTFGLDLILYILTFSQRNGVLDW